MIKRQLILPVLAIASICQVTAADFSAYSLRCENLESPVGIEAKQPRFSWFCHSDSRDFTQGGYRILVATSPDELKEGNADIWDSGWIESSESNLVTFSGENLDPGTTYYWTVAIKNSDGVLSPYSSPTRFTTGLYSDDDWQGALWIAYEADKEIIAPFHDEPYAKENIAEKTIGQYRMPQFRKQFSLKDKKVKAATAHVAGLGHFDFFINGNKVGDHFLDAGWTNYGQEAQYVTFDVTPMLNEGDNLIGVMLGNGYYNIPNERYFKMTGSFGAPKTRVLLNILYEDGSFENVITDDTWKVTESPITFSSIFGGEDYDATKIIKGWKLPGFNDSDWKKPVIVKDYNVNLYSAPGTELKIIQDLPTNSVNVLPNGRIIYDLGQNFSGIVSMTVKGKPGQTITLTPGEVLENGDVSQQSSGAPFFYRYTIGSDSIETWQPQFTYYGQRYIAVDGATDRRMENSSDTLPLILELSGRHTTAATRPTGNFECSNPLFNKIATLIDWAIRSNSASILTDCPHREKLGWQEEAHLMQPSLQYRYDMASIYPKIMRDLEAAQLENGCVPTIAPEFVRFKWGFEDTPEWGSSSIICPWNYYLWYGDDSLLKKHYPMMKAYADYLGSRAEDNIITYGLGDWYDIGPNPPGYAQLTSNGITATAIYYADIRILQQAAAKLGLKADEEKYAQLAADIKNAYNKRFYNDSLKTYDRGSQTANAISYSLGLAEGEQREAAIKALEEDIVSRGYSLTAGDVGYRYVLAALTDAGRPELVYMMNSRYDTPGYGWQLAHGATALTESWQAFTSSSNNHFMLGHILEWLYSSLLGIRQTSNSAGFAEVTIDPMPCGDISRASGTVRGRYGDIDCGWNLQDDIYKLSVRIPENSSGEIWLPTDNEKAVSEHGIALEHVKGIRKIEHRDGRLCVVVGSGVYNFTVNI